jgi:hypothetical protein
MRVIRKEIRKRGIFGWIFLLIFLAFNAFMTYMLAAWFLVLAHAPPAGSEGGKVGFAIGAGIGLTAILVLWVLGSLITGLLALLTRGRKTIITEEYQEPRF